MWPAQHDPDAASADDAGGHMADKKRAEGHGQEPRHLVVDAASMSDQQQHLTRQRSPGNYPDRRGKWRRYTQPVACPLSAHGLIVAPGSRMRLAPPLGNAGAPRTGIERLQLLDYGRRT